MSDSKYAQGHSASSQSRHGSRNAQNTCQYFTSLLKPSMQILDVGCGPGSISSSLALFVPQGKVIGIDRSEKTLENARSQANLPANCTFQIGDAMSVDFPDESFDVVHTSQVLCHLLDPVSAIREFRRVLKPGGFIACREGDQAGKMWYPEHPGLVEWQRIQHEVHASTGASAHAGRLLLKWAVDAGFEVGKCTYTGGTMTYAGREGAVVGESLAKQTLDDETYRGNVLGQGIADEEGLRLVREGWQAWCKDPCCVFSMICGEVVAYK